jgi:hypothetical protein
MARIPSEELEALRSTVELSRLVESKGIALTKRGSDLVGLCPFHDDKGPSLVVTPSKNLWHCFGCGAGGDVVQWVMKSSGVSFRHAVELLREGAAVGGEVLRKARQLTAPVVPTLAATTLSTRSTGPLDALPEGATMMRVLPTVQSRSVTSPAPMSTTPRLPRSTMRG